MIWDIFSGRRRGEKGGEKDEFDLIIEQIEKFAPRKYLSERRQFYYNYKILSLYGRPLLQLLGVIARCGQGSSDPQQFGAELFRSLKEFYDPKDRLSVAEAKGDNELIRRYGELFLLFYGKKRPTRDEISQWLSGTR